MELMGKVDHVSMFKASMHVTQVKLLAGHCFTNTVMFEEGFPFSGVGVGTYAIYLHTFCLIYFSSILGACIKQR